MNFVHGVFYIAIFSNMAQRQRSRYRVVNNVTTATLESKTKNTWKRHWQKRNGKSLNSLYLGVSNSFKDDSSKLNNHFQIWRYRNATIESESICVLNQDSLSNV